MATDFFGRQMVSAADLDEMTPAERQASFEDSLVLEPDLVPGPFRQRLLDRVGPRIAERDREQAPQAHRPPSPDA